jgi:hypothetical protein
MKRLSSRLLAVTLFLACFQSMTAWAETVPVRMTSLDPRFDQLVSRDAKLETIADGFIWVEGPVWQTGRVFALLGHSGQPCLQMEGGRGRQPLREEQRL